MKHIDLVSKAMHLRLGNCIILQVKIRPLPKSLVAKGHYFVFLLSRDNFFLGDIDKGPSHQHHANSVNVKELSVRR